MKQHRYMPKPILLLLLTLSFGLTNAQRQVDFYQNHVDLFLKNHPDLKGTTAPTEQEKITTNPADTNIAILFAYGKYDLDTVEKNKLRACYNQHIVHDSVLYLALYISGYTDTVGTDNDNFKLSEKRALQVGKFLQSLAGGPVIRKWAILDAVTECGGFSFRDTQEVRIVYNYYGKTQLKGMKIDSSQMPGERKVSLRFEALHSLCDNYPGCYLPLHNMVVSKDSTIKVLVPRGYSDQYTLPNCTTDCDYDSSTRYSVAITDTFISKVNLCEQLLPYYTTGAKPAPVKIGSIRIKPFLADGIVPKYRCSDDTNKFNYPLARLWVSSKLFPVKTSYVTSGNYTPVEQPINNDSVVVLVPSNHHDGMEIIDFYATPQTATFKTETLVVKGRGSYMLYTKEPEAKCEIPYTITGTKKSLFSNYTTYTGIKFRQSTPVYLFNNQTNQTISTKIFAFKYDTRKAQYVLKRKALKKLEKQQPKK